MPLRFLHCSDIHLLSLRGVGPHRFLNKRLTGGVNLMLKRGKHHDEALFDRIVGGRFFLEFELPPQPGQFHRISGSGLSNRCRWLRILHRRTIASAYLNRRVVSRPAIGLVGLEDDFNERGSSVASR